MITLRKSEDRGKLDREWLKAYYSFTFNTYHDPAHMGFGPLRVINEDRFGPGRGFGMHPHEDMEIITYVRSGVLGHEDNTGGKGVLRPGDIQRMSAGSGVMHSEFNPSETDVLHLFQIWIEPNVMGATPRYGEAHFDDADKQGKLLLIVSGDGRDSSMAIYQDASIYAGILGAGDKLTHKIAPSRRVYVQVVEGDITIGGQHVTTGDAVKIEGEAEVVLENATKAEVLLFDLP
jgi:quercetin 2,3-dioxygenase